MDLPKFFSELVTKVQNRRAKFRDCDYWFILVGLLYLKAQANLPAVKRDSTEKEAVWRKIWPHLQTSQIMHDYKESFILKSRLEIFLRR